MVFQRLVGRSPLPSGRIVRELGKTDGEDHYFDFTGWREGKPYTLRFSWGGDDGSGNPNEDDALPAR